MSFVISKICLLNLDHEMLWILLKLDMRMTDLKLYEICYAY